MAAAPGSSASNPRKFSEKIALHNQKQAEETRAFEQLMTDLTLSRVQFQKLQQLHLAQTRAQYYGGSLPNVNQIGNNTADFQTACHPMDNIRRTRHHGLVERVPRNRLSSPHLRPVDKHVRQLDSSPYGNVYLSPPPDNNWRRHQSPWSEEKRPGFKLISTLNRTNSDSALHTSALNPNPQDPFEGGNQTVLQAPRPPQRNASLHDGDIDSTGEVFSFPAHLNEEALLNSNRPLPKQLWEAKKVQSLSSRPKSCEVPGISIFPSSQQNTGLSHFQGTLNTGGSLPDLTNLHFPSPLPTPLDPEDATFSNISGGNSTGNLPAAMTHLGISSSPGVSSLSNPSIQASLSNSAMASPLNSPALQSSLGSPSLHPSLRLSSLSNPSLPTAALSSSPRRRHTPVSPLTLSPGTEPHRTHSKQYSPTFSESLPSSTQGISIDRSPLPMEPPPPYPLYQQQQSQQSLEQQQSQHSQGGEQRQQQQQQPVSPLHHLSLDLNSTSSSSLGGFFSDSNFEQQLTARQTKALSQQLEHFNMLESPVNSLPTSCTYFDPGSNLNYSQAMMMGLSGSHGNLQDSLQLKSSFLYSNCGGSVPNIILTDDSSPMLSKNMNSVLAGVPEVTFDVDTQFQFDNDLKIEPLSLDGLSMLSDPDMVLPDPSVEDTFRSDRL